MDRARHTLKTVLKELLPGLIVLALHAAAYTFLFGWFFYQVPLKADYFAPSIFAAALAKPGFLLPILLGCLPPALCWRQTRWRGLSRDGVSLRVFVTAMSLVLAISYSTYNYNLYVDQPHTFDRLALLATAALVAVHPGFLALFLPLCLIMMAQFNFPFGGYTVTDKYLVYTVLILYLTLVELFAAGCLAARYAGKLKLTEAKRESLLRFLVRLRSPVFALALALVAVGATYLSCGIGKLELGRGPLHVFDWIVYDEFHISLRQYFARGWWTSLSSAAKEQLIQIVGSLNAVLLLGAVIVEVAGIAFLASRRYAIAVLGVFILLHLGILSMTGIFFWKWICLNAGLMLVLWKLPQRAAERLFSRKTALVGASLMCLSLLFFRPINLAWWNLRYYPYFRWEVVGASGQVYALEENWMTPYHIHFTFHRYEYLIERDVYRRTQIDPDEERLVNEHGLSGLQRLPTVNRYDEAMKRRTDEFLVRYFRNLNARGSREHWLSRFEVPHHLQMRRTGEDYPLYRLQEPVTKVICRYVEEYHEDEREIVLSDDVVYTVGVPSGARGTEIAVQRKTDSSRE